MKKLLSLFLVVGFIALLIGCHSGGHSPFANPGRNGEPAQTLTATVNANGQFPAAMVFSSGATINTTENNTMQEGVVVNVTETKTSSLGVNPMGEPAYIYVYTITANLITHDALGNDVSTPVSSLEKPITITLPTEHLGTTGIAYVGIRASESEPWRFSKVSEDGTVTISIRNLRASSTEKLSSSYKFGLFKMGIQLALFVYNKPVEETSSDISADSLNVTCTEKILYDDSDKYTDDLDVALKIKGINLDRLRASDFAIKVIYRSENKTPESIKADGQTCGISTEEKADAAVSGKSYFVHTLTVPALNEGSLMSGEAGLKFTLNLKGIATADFPTSFLVEISNKGNIENLIPFTYSNSMEFTAEKASTPGPEPEPEPTGSTYTITYNLGGGSLVEGFTNPSEYGEASETFTLNNPIKTGYTFAGWTSTDLEVATTEVTITTGSTGDREYTATWTENAPDTYKITYNGVDGATFETDNPSTYSVNSLPLTLNNPSKTGYTFTGWTGSNGDVPQKQVSIVQGSASDMSFTANWTINSYNLTINKGTGIATVTGAGSYEAGTSVTASCTMQEGYEFANWTGNITTEHFIMPEENVTMTANATPIEYTISYIINGGEFAEGVASPTVYTVESEGFSVPTPTKSNYNFKAWYDKNGDSIATIVPGTTGDKILTASYTPKFFNITYNLADGSLAQGVTNPASYSIESSLITLNNPTRDGYVFLGWTGTDIATGTASKTVTIPLGSTGNRSYVASWSLNNVLTFTLAEGVTLEMRRCPAGTFTMGSPDTETGRKDNETQHQVTISKDFYMGTYEVTQAQYMAIMGSNPSAHNTYGTGESEANLPVEKVSWANIMTDSTGFIAKLNASLTAQLPTGYRFDLPTEAQWEYACRAGTTTSLNNDTNIVNENSEDSNLNAVGWYRQNWGQSNGKTHTVGVKTPNAWGLYDMHGNVFEWCKDLYASDYYTTCGDCTNPQGPDSGSFRILRGGSWNGTPNRCRSAFRGNDPPSNKDSSYGFRLALVAPSN